MDNNSYYCEDDTYGDFEQDPSAIRSPPEAVISIFSSFPIFPSLLPQYTEKIEVPSDMTLLERVLSTFTMYGELKNATLDSQYERVFGRLQMEWTYIGGLVRLMSTSSSLPNLTDLFMQLVAMAA